MKKTLILLLTAFMVMQACTTEGGQRNNDDAQHADSLALHVAIMPVLSALPVYYAQSVGLTDSAGLDLRLLPYNAQMDVDTAALRRHADIFLTDYFRILRLHEQTSMCMLMQTNEPLSLVAHPSTRATQVNQLKEKMLAISRLSVTDAWCDELLATASLEPADIYRPQIHNTTLRYNMLHTNSMDAAILPEPFASAAVLKDNKRLCTTHDSLYCHALWATPDSTANNEHKAAQLQRFVEVYNKAVEQMSAGALPDTIRAILVREYHLTPELTDSLTLPIPQPATTPDSMLTARAKEWLKGRNALKETATPLPRVAKHILRP